MRTVTTCGAFIQNDDGNILVLLRSASDERRPVRWDLPGGHADSGETLEQALEREVLEETGLTVNSTPRLVYARSATFDDVSVNWLFFAVAVEDGVLRLSSEHSEHRWVSLDEAAGIIDYEPKQLAVEYVRMNELLHV